MQALGLALFLTFFSKHISIIQLGNTTLLQLAHKSPIHAQDEL
jgi:hypothetical protein